MILYTCLKSDSIWNDSDVHWVLLFIGHRLAQFDRIIRWWCSNLGQGLTFPSLFWYCYVLSIRVPPLKCFLDTSPSPFVYQLSLPSAILRLICTALCTRFFTLIPVMDCLYKQAYIPTSLHRTSCTRCISALGLLSRSLLAPVSPRRDPVCSLGVSVMFLK